MFKKADIWVSAVLYIALGMILITLILSAGLPLIGKMRDKNTIVQTKNLLFNLHANIETVANEGVGSTRYISPFVVSSGSLNIERDKDRIIWKMTTKSLMMEPNDMATQESNLETFKEGALTMWMMKTAVEGEYEIYLELGYEGRFDITSDPVDPASLTGKYSLSVQNLEAGDIPKIFLDVT